MLRSLAVAVVLLLAPGSAAADAAAARWQWPVDGARAVARPFIAPTNPYSSGHRGIDVRASADALYAPADGIVRFVGVVVDRPVLSIEHADGLVSSYEPVQSSLAEGDPVARGDPIGVILPGHCSSLCVHMGLRRDGQYVSPLNYLGGLEPSVLLPTRR